MALCGRKCWKHKAVKNNGTGNGLTTSVTTKSLHFCVVTAACSICLNHTRISSVLATAADDETHFHVPFQVKLFICWDQFAFTLLWWWSAVRSQQLSSPSLRAPFLPRCKCGINRRLEVFRITSANGPLWQKLGEIRISSPSGTSYRLFELRHFAEVQFLTFLTKLSSFHRKDAPIPTRFAVLFQDFWQTGESCLLPKSKTSTWTDIYRILCPVQWEWRKTFFVAQHVFTRAVLKIKKKDIHPMFPKKPSKWMIPWKGELFWGSGSEIWLKTEFAPEKEEISGEESLVSKENATQNSPHRFITRSRTETTFLHRKRDVHPAQANTKRTLHSIQTSFLPRLPYGRIFLSGMYLFVG